MEQIRFLWYPLDLHTLLFFQIYLWDTEYLRMVGFLGYEMETAAEGVEALHLYEKAVQSGRPFDAVILDLTI